jgi:hypothetical protein
MIRELVRSRIINTGALTAIIPADRWYGSHGMVDTPGPRPFAEIRFGGIFKGVGGVTRRRLEIWIHDEEGTYATIDTVIGLLKTSFDGATHISDANSEIIQADWVSDSTDLYDDGYRTITKVTGFDLVGKGV